MSVVAASSNVVPASPGPAAPCAVQADKLALRLDDRTILKNVTLHLAPGTTLALLGANGAGKSTLLKVLAMLLHPTGGTLRLFGQPAGPLAGALRARLGIIAHQPMLYRDLTLTENLRFFGKLYGRSDTAARAAELLDRVGLSDRAGDLVKTLSRGMTQRVAIARALMHDPDLLLADEPFDGLDAPSVRTTENLLRGLREQGKTLIVSNHDVRQSLELADEVVVLRRGAVVLRAPAAQLTVESVLAEMTRA
ncbi:MAG: ABC transporter ATP-binding protein [Planctomycetota bacterium]|nr:ABC transporter ATP-binding protein [Planctomycetota bacterium]